MNNNIPFQNQRQWESQFRPFLSKIAQSSYSSVDNFIQDFTSFLKSIPMFVFKNILNINNFYQQIYQTEPEGYFFKEFLPNLAKLALEIETMQLQSTKLKRFDPNPQIFTRSQIASILANMFFCTIDHQGFNSFIMWYDQEYRAQTKIEKIKCIYNYFKRIFNAENLQDNIIIQRLQYNQNEQLQNTLLNTKIEISSDKRIEDFEEDNLVQIDFSNQSIGGGVLSSGRVQEEILFVTHPELLITTLICEQIEDKEAILISGSQRYSEYTGYAETFAFSKDHIDKRKNTRIVAMDALFFQENILYMQYQNTPLYRELVKALTGFQVNQNIPKDCTIVSGNWGCGAFHGDVQLKFIIQWIACSMQGRDLIYCTFQNERLKNVDDIIKALKGQCAGKIINVIIEYQNKWKEYDLFSFILQKFNA